MLLCHSLFFLLLSTNALSELQNVAWWNVTTFFRNIYDKGLQAKDIQNILEEDFEWTREEVVSPEELLTEKLKNVEEIFRQHIKAVQKFVQAITNSFEEYKTSKHQHHCCRYRQGTELLRNGCSYGGPEDSGLAAGTPKTVIDQINDILGIYDLVSNLYMAFEEDGSAFFFPLTRSAVHNHNDAHCRAYNPKRRPWYVLCKLPKPRDVVILLDLNDLNRKLTIKTASEVIRSLTPEDRLVIVNNYTELRGGYGRHVDFNVWIVGTERNKEKCISLIEDASATSNPYNLTGAANSLFKSPMKNPLKISREPELVVVIISSRNEYLCGYSTPNHENGTKVLAYQVGENKSQDSTCDNYSNGNHLLMIGNENDLKKVNVWFSSFFKWEDYKNESFDPLSVVKLPVPYTDYYAKQNVLSFCFPIIHKNKFKGAACSDVWLANELESMIQVPGIDEAYGFIVDRQGRALIHPLLPSIYCRKANEGSSYLKCKEPTYELISRLEQVKSVHEVLQGMVNHTIGSKIVDGELIHSLGHPMEGKYPNAVTIKKQRLLYVWSNFTLTDLSLALVLPIENGKVFRTTYKCKSEEKCKTAKFRYHLDGKGINNPKKTCNYFGSVINKEKSVESVKFSPTAFKDVGAYYRSAQPNTDAIMEAIKSKSRDYYELLKENNINESVVLVEKTGSLWKKDSLECFIGFRYLGTTNGVFMTFPGITLNATYDHRERPWYQMAVSSRRNHPTISVSMPYMDFFSGTRVQSVMFPLEHVTSSGKTVLVGVASGDFSLDFLSSKLRALLPECDGETLTCFLMDATGYISVHLHPPKGRDSPQMHISEADPAIAEHLVEHQLLNRTGCHDYEMDFILLYWNFEMPYNERRYRVSSESSLNFTIYEIPYMNIFLVASTSKAIHNPKQRSPTNINCSSSCVNKLDLPCRVVSETETCNVEKLEMRRNFDRLPACWPSNKSPRTESKLPCKPDVASCYERYKPECKMWKPECF